MKRTIAILNSFAICCLLFAGSHAADCIQYKTIPTVELKTPQWTRNVSQPADPMDLWHGNVVATLVQDFEIIGDTSIAPGGVCVALKSVSATIGYNEFLVSIDARHKPDSCAYDAILAHEDGHILKYLSVVDDQSAQIKSALALAANSLAPVFVADGTDPARALDILHEQLESHPDVILMRQKIQAEQELRNKKFDDVADKNELQKCFKGVNYDV